MDIVKQRLIRVLAKLEERSSLTPAYVDLEKLEGAAIELIGEMILQGLVVSSKETKDG